MLKVHDRVLGSNRLFTCASHSPWNPSWAELLWARPRRPSRLQISSFSPFTADW